MRACPAFLQPGPVLEGPEEPSTIPQREQALCLVSSTNAGSLPVTWLQAERRPSITSPRSNLLALLVSTSIISPAENVDIFHVKERNNNNINKRPGTLKVLGPSHPSYPLFPIQSNTTCKLMRNGLRSTLLDQPIFYQGQRRCRC